MPKMKSHKAAQKRIGATGSGKVIRVRAWRGQSIIGPTHKAQVRRLLPYL